MRQYVTQSALRVSCIRPPVTTCFRCPIPHYSSNLASSSRQVIRTIGTWTADEPEGRNIDRQIDLNDSRSGRSVGKARGPAPGRGSTSRQPTGSGFGMNRGRRSEPSSYQAENNSPRQRVPYRDSGDSRVARGGFGLAGRRQALPNVTDRSPTTRSSPTDRQRAHRRRSIDDEPSYSSPFINDVGNDNLRAISRQPTTRNPITEPISHHSQSRARPLDTLDKRAAATRVPTVRSSPVALPCDDRGPRSSPIRQSPLISNAPRQGRRVADSLGMRRSELDLQEFMDTQPRHREARHLGKEIDHTNLVKVPKIDGTFKSVVRFLKPDFETVLPILRNKTKTQIRQPHFWIRAAIQADLPPPPPSPFPEHLQLRKQSKKAFKGIYLGIIVTKANVSKLANERNRVRSRFKQAFNLVVNRGAKCPDGVSGWDLVSEDIAYFVNLEPSLIKVPMDDICESVYKALEQLQRRLQSPIGGFQDKRPKMRMPTRG